MTTLRASQIVTISAVASAALQLELSQMVVITVIGNGKDFKPMGPVIGLGCWTPCGTLLYNGE